MSDGADPLMPDSFSSESLLSDSLSPPAEAKVSPERALGILLLAMLAITVLLMVRTH